MALTGGGQGSLWLWTPSSSRLVATWHRPHRHLRRAQRDRLSWRLPPGGRWPPPCLRTSKGGSRLPGGRRRQKAVWRARPICSIRPPCARVTEGQPCILRGLDAPVPAITTRAGHGAEPLSAASPSRLNHPRALGIGGQSAWGQLGPPSPSSPWWGGACVHLGSAGGAGLPGEGAAWARAGGQAIGVTTQRGVGLASQLLVENTLRKGEGALGGDPGPATGGTPGNSKCGASLELLCRPPSRQSLPVLSLRLHQQPPTAPRPEGSAASLQAPERTSRRSPQLGPGGQVLAQEEGDCGA